jgi:diamine N-acetyltransferase
LLTLTGQHIKLRALEPSDLYFLEATENDEALWHLSNSLVPFSRYQLEQYLLSAKTDLFDAKQLRLVIAKQTNEPLGFIDLFDFEPQHKRAGIGIVISKKELRGKGYGKEALGLLINYAFKRLNLHQLHCDILEDNKNSLKLFEDAGFTIIGLKRDWFFWEGSFHNTWQLQLINQ